MKNEVYTRSFLQIIESRRFIMFLFRCQWTVVPVYNSIWVTLRERLYRDRELCKSNPFILGVLRGPTVIRTVSTVVPFILKHQIT